MFFNTVYYASFLVCTRWNRLFLAGDCFVEWCADLGSAAEVLCGAAGLLCFDYKNK
jgi:hypothetical protein